jgi:hypothetical protein
MTLTRVILLLMAVAVVVVVARTIWGLRSR